MTRPASVLCVHFTNKRMIKRENYKPDSHHDDHHDWKDGDCISRHVHDKHVHGRLFEGTQGQIPRPFGSQVRGGRVPL